MYIRILNLFEEIIEDGRFNGLVQNNCSLISRWWEKVEGKVPARIRLVLLLDYAITGNSN